MNRSIYDIWRYICSLIYLNYKYKCKYSRHLSLSLFFSLSLSISFSFFVFLYLFFPSCFFLSHSCSPPLLIYYINYPLFTLMFPLEFAWHICLGFRLGPMRSCDPRGQRLCAGCGEGSCSQVSGLGGISPTF